MNSWRAVCIVLALCIALVVVVYVLGVEVGRATALRTHPGYEAAALRSSIAPSPPPASRTLD